MTKKSVYTGSSMNTTIAIFLLSALMIGFSIYLTGGYFELKFPTGLESGSLCNLNSFLTVTKQLYQLLQTLQVFLYLFLES